MNASPLLRWVTDALDAAAIPYMVVGSFASSWHGVPRSTHDLDLVIDPTPQALDRFLRGIDLERYYVDLDVARAALRERSMFNVVDSELGWKIDLVIRKNTRHAVAELARRAPGTVLGVTVKLASPEDVIIAKLAWSRLGGSRRQLDDVAGILQVRGDQLDREYLDGWIEELGLGELWAQAQRDV